MATISLPRSSSPAISTITSPPIQSGSNTPTSSTRLSQELPSSPTAQPAPPLPTENQRRNRAALRDYYNLKSKAGAAATGGVSPVISTQNLSRTASIKSTTSDATYASSAATLTTSDGTYNSSLPSALDDPSFDAEAFIADLLKTSTLRDILKVESSLISEIRTLDGERKALVYDNYSKLIVAVGTIGEMQRGIVQDGQEQERMTLSSIGNTDRGVSAGTSGLSRMKTMEKKLDDLMTIFQEMNHKKTGETDDTTTETKTSTTRKVRESRKKQELVQWVLGTPDRIRALLQDGKQQEAKTEYEEVEDILRKWDGVKGVSELREACKQALTQEDQDSGDDDGDGGKAD